jgi:hypothetical protein
LANLK